MYLLWDLSSVSQSTWTHHLLRQSLRPLRQDPQGRRSSRSSEELADLSSSSSSSSTSWCPRGGLQPGVWEWQSRFFSFYVTVWFISLRNYFKIKFSQISKESENYLDILRKYKPRLSRWTIWGMRRRRWRRGRWRTSRRSPWSAPGRTLKIASWVWAWLINWGLDSTLCYIVYTVQSTVYYNVQCICSTLYSVYYMCRVLCYCIISGVVRYTLNWSDLQTTMAWLTYST